MPEFLDNPRRVPRDPVRCRAHVVTPTGKVETTTEDIGARGCQVVLPAALERGAVVALTLSAPRVESSLRIGGRVAWVSPRPPWRVGIAFSPECLGEAARWMETLRQTTPELFSAGRRPHEKVAVEAMVFLGVAPRLADFSDDELTVLRKVWAGVKVGELRASFAGRWPRMQRGFFALLAQGYLTLSRAASAHPVTWRAIFGEQRPPAPPTFLDADLEPSAEVSGARTPPPIRAARPTAPGAPAAVPPPLPARAAGAAAPTWPVTDSARRTHTPVPDFVGAGVGWRGTAARPRSSEADTLFQLALVELQGKNHHQALKLLRSALTLAPGDPEIADAIARAMKAGR